ncbi:MAG: hypothetical protein O2923_04345 [Verrucomicrobia bacterium]|nr:hypothetical protein [Verrucomicrobiota bacterium]MDA1086637.1 hypothetical protein [Verrucomicrobiota bacterium]
MKEQLAKVGTALRRHYDKIIALAAVLALGASGLLYVTNGRAIEREQRDLEEWLRTLAPTFPANSVVDVSAFEGAARLHQNQVQIAQGDVTIFRPEKRYTCHDCRRPRPFLPEGVKPEDHPCPFCFVIDDVPPELPDFDQDGMLDRWEAAHGLDSGDPADAAYDPDKDGFTNLEEHAGDPQTTPRDPQSHPPILQKLTLHRLGEVSLNLTFQGWTQLEGEKPRVSINRGSQTYWRYIGEKIFGFTLKGLNAKTTERQISPDSSSMIVVDVSELVLEKDGEEIILILGHQEKPVIYYAEIKFRIDGSLYEKLFLNSEFELDPNSPYKGRKFKVIGIDRQKKRVLVQDAKTSRKRWFEE